MFSNCEFDCMSGENTFKLTVFITGFLRYIQNLKIAFCADVISWFKMSHRLCKVSILNDHFAFDNRVLAKTVCRNKHFYLAYASLPFVERISVFHHSKNEILVSIVLNFKLDHKIILTSYHRAVARLKVWGGGICPPFLKVATALLNTALYLKKTTLYLTSGPKFRRGICSLCRALATVRPSGS